MDDGDGKQGLLQLLGCFADEGQVEGQDEEEQAGGEGEYALGLGRRGRGDGEGVRR